MTTTVPTTVTLVSAVRLRAGSEQAHRRLHDAAVTAAARLGGLVRAELVPAIPGVQDETVALLTFIDRAALDEWLVANARTQALDAMAHLVAGDRTVTVVGDYAGWFTAGSNRATPKRWKQALAVVAGLIPVAAAVTELRAALLPDIPTLAAVCLASACNVAALTWLVMPPLTRVLKPWLSR